MRFLLALLFQGVGLAAWPGTFVVKTKAIPGSSGGLRRTEYEKFGDDILLGLVDYQDVQYIGDVSTSGREQSYDLVFDTGSADIWVTSDMCDSCQKLQKSLFPSSICSQSCTSDSDPTALDSSKAQMCCKDAKQPSKFNIKYGAGPVSGAVVKAEIYGSLINLGLAVSESISNFDKLPIDGILGLGFPNLQAVGRPQLPLLVQLHKDKRLDSAVFAFYFDPEEEKSHHIVLGGYDEENLSKFTVGKVVWTPVIKQMWWTAGGFGLNVNSNKFAKDEKFMVDSGGSIIYAPKAALNALFNKLDYYSQRDFRLKAAIVSGHHLVPCKLGESVTITFTIAGSTYDIKLGDLMLPIDHKTYCNMGFGESVDNFWVLGNNFMRVVYSIFDYGDYNLTNTCDISWRPGCPQMGFVMKIPEANYVYSALNADDGDEPPEKYTDNADLSVGVEETLHV